MAKDTVRVVVSQEAYEVIKQQSTHGGDMWNHHQVEGGYEISLSKKVLKKIKSRQKPGEPIGDTLARLCLTLRGYEAAEAAADGEAPAIIDGGARFKKPSVH